MTRPRQNRVQRALVLSFGAVSVFVAVLVVGSAAADARRVLGERIVYTREEVFGTDVWVMWPDGSGRRQLALTSIGRNGSVAVAPTGTRLAYTSAVTEEFPTALPPRLRRRFVEHPETAPTLGVNPVRFVDETGGSFSLFVSRQAVAVYGRPAWGPRGRTLAISIGRPGVLRLALRGVGSASPIRDLPTKGIPGGDELNPAWSPDGRLLAFQLVDGAQSQLYVIPSQGGEARALTTPGWHDTYPSWSPSGKTIVFASNRSGLDQLFEVDAKGQQLVQLTHDRGNSERPAWSPDGKWIAYSNDRDLEYDIFRIDPNGHGERRLTTTPGDELVQGWQPLHDVTPPRVRALPSSGKTGGPIFLRYRAADASGTVVVGATASWPGNDDSGGLVFVRHARGFGVSRRYRLSRDNIAPGQTLPSAFRFCIFVSDPSGNRGKNSCSTYREADRCSQDVAGSCKSRQTELSLDPPFFLWGWGSAIGCVFWVVSSRGFWAGAVGVCSEGVATGLARHCGALLSAAWGRWSFTR